MRLLIAEDDFTSAKMLEAILRKWGHQVLTVGDGTEAWNVLNTPEAPLLAILDWMMPGMDGIELVRRLRNREGPGPCYLIMLTSRNEKRDSVEALEAGADDYLSKPYDNEELWVRIEVGRRMVELQSALADQAKELEEAARHIRVLQGILPICMHCRKIRADQEIWERMEKYITEHSGIQFSHSVCPECLETKYRGFAVEIGSGKQE